MPSLRRQDSQRLDEMMTVTALQTVCYELLVVLQGPPVDLVPDPFGGFPPFASSAPTPSTFDDVDVPDAEEGDALDDQVLSPLDLLSAYQSAIINRPSTSAECHELVGTLTHLLEQIAPPLGQMATFEPLSATLGEFLNLLPQLRGEALLQAEERLLAEITTAAERDQDVLVEGTEEEEAE